MPAVASKQMLCLLIHSMYKQTESECVHTGYRQGRAGPKKSKQDDGIKAIMVDFQYCAERSPQQIITSRKVLTNAGKAAKRQQRSKRRASKRSSTGGGWLGGLSNNSHEILGHDRPRCWAAASGGASPAGCPVWSLVERIGLLLGRAAARCVYNFQ
jgi:hypothetical protein